MYTWTLAAVVIGQSFTVKANSSLIKRSLPNDIRIGRRAER